MQVENKKSVADRHVPKPPPIHALVDKEMGDCELIVLGLGSGHRICIILAWWLHEIGDNKGSLSFTHVPHLWSSKSFTIIIRHNMLIDHKPFKYTYWWQLLVSCAELNFEAFDILVVSRTLLSRAIYSSYASILLPALVNKGQFSVEQECRTSRPRLYLFSLQPFGMGYGWNLSDW